MRTICFISMGILLKSRYRKRVINTHTDCIKKKIGSSYKHCVVNLIKIKVNDLYTDVRKIKTVSRLGKRSASHVAAYAGD